MDALPASCVFHPILYRSICACNWPVCVRNVYHTLNCIPIYYIVYSCLKKRFGTHANCNVVDLGKISNKTTDIKMQGN